MSTNTIVVSKSGSDSTGARGNSAAPFLTLTAAKSVSVPGDTIIVNPGVYEENDLLKDGVNWHLMNGALIKYTIISDEASQFGIFDDHGAKVTSNITGEGNLLYNTGEYNPNPDAFTVGSSQARGCIVIGNASSKINITLNKLTYQSLGSGNTAAIYVTNCKEVHVYINELRNDLTSTNYAKTLEVDHGFTDYEELGYMWEFPCHAMGVYWEFGELYVNIGHMDYFGAYCIWSNENGDGAHTANMYYSGHTLDGKIYQSAHSLTYVLWVNVDYQNGKGADNVNNFFGGKVYFTANKCGSTNNRANLFDCSSSVAGADGEVWIDVQKVSGYGKWLVTAGNNGHTNRVYANINHYEDLGGVVNGFEIGPFSDVHISPGYAKILNGSGINFLGGKAEAKGLTIDTSNTNKANNHPVKVAANGLMLQGCLLIAPPSADSIFATSSVNVGVLNSMTNKSKNPNVKLSPNGTLIVDSNLQ